MNQLRQWILWVPAHQLEIYHNLLISLMNQKLLRGHWLTSWSKLIIWLTKNPPLSNLRSYWMPSWVALMTRLIDYRLNTWKALDCNMIHFKFNPQLILCSNTNWNSSINFQVIDENGTIANTTTPSFPQL